MKFLFILLALYPSWVFGQLNDTLLASFYNRTLEYYFLDTTFNPKQKKSPEQKKFGFELIQCSIHKDLLVTKLSTKKIKTKIKIKYFDTKTEIRSMLVKPWKRNRRRRYYYAYHKAFGQDTLDVCINVLHISKISKNKMWIGVEDGGTMGYIPNGRFIFDRHKNNWLFMNWNDVVEQYMKDLRLRDLEQKRLWELEQKKE